MKAIFHDEDFVQKDLLKNSPERGKMPNVKVDKIYVFKMYVTNFCEKYLAIMEI